MSVIEMPREPDVDRVWTPGTEESVIEWHRSVSVESGMQRWVNPATGQRRRWVDLIVEYGEVHTAHPDLGRVPPTPWALALDEQDRPTVVDAENCIVPSRDDDVLAFVVRAVNELAERITGGTS